MHHAHQTDLRIAEHYTDTAGATDHVFGLCHLLGFRFAPRVKDLKDLVAELMAARRAKQTAIRANDGIAREAARSRVDAAKVASGERGPVWWDDGAADFTRCLARTTPYADWFAILKL